MTYVLILTLAALTNAGGSTIGSVPGFASEASCRVAGDAWLRSVQQGHAPYRPVAVCVATR